MHAGINRCLGHYYKLTTERLGVILALEAYHSRSILRVEQHERTGVPANPLGNALLWLLVAQAREILTIAAAFLEDSLDPLMARAGDPEVHRVDRIREV